MSSNTTNQDDRVFHDEGLTRKLGLSTAIAIGIGTTVGSGIFTSIGEIAGASGSALFIALSFLLGGLYQIPPCSMLRSILPILSAVACIRPLNSPAGAP